MLYTRPPRVEALEGDPLEAGAGDVVVPVFKSKDGSVKLEGTAARADELVGGALSGAVKAGRFKGDVGETLAAYTREGRSVVFVGVGEEGVEEHKMLENARSALAAAVKGLVEKSQEATLVLSELGNAGVEALVGALLGAYKMEAFKNEKKARLSRLLVDLPGDSIREAVAIAEGVYLARDLANAPPHEVAPPRLAERLRDLFSGLENVDVEVFDYDRLVREGFGGIVNVGRGSEEKPRLVVIRYRGGEGDPVALVGKTIVFDAGGINLKPSQSLFEMRADKAGGAAVVGATWTIARLGLKVNLVTLVPAAINVPSGSSYLPSDVIRMWDGTYVEVTNTDAEGRLVLADAIAYAAKSLAAREIIDLATLTGAAWIALGPLYAALFTRREDLAKAIEEASKKTGERVWRLPLVDEYKAMLGKKAPVGEVANAAMRAGGAICAALFLERFTHGKPWAHLDIAGPGIGSDAGPMAPKYWPQGLAPGWGVRLLVEYVRSKAGG
ncbi:MAG: leucyl aminopeptidase family protein [Desulfurococcales archaeon]|nr:leucyl aminopeptidase family protein [Desulfurococcales archaeon]